MNKKFLSAILFGAFLASSTGTFVSCKDYDDDIKDLQEQINQKASLTDLQSQVTTLATDLAAAKTAAAQAVTAAEKAVADAKTASEKAVADAKLATAQAKAEAIAAAEAKVNEMQKELQTAIDTKMTNINSLVDKVSALAEEVSGIVGKRLTSLVFQPAFYYQGIEAMEAIGITYNALTVADVNADGDFPTDAPKAGDETTIVPDLVADYHINPTAAEVPADASAYTFLRFDKTYARSAETVPTVVKATADKGMLTVNAHFTDADIKDITADGKVTVLALQVHTGDTVVTSDYAAVKANNYKDLTLAAVDSIHEMATADRHLFATAAAAIADNEHVCNIAWNSEGIDIARLVNTHRTDLEGNHSKWDERAADGTVTKYGFKYTYELVGYHEGNNKTSESAHAALKGSVIRPQMTSDGKQQAWGFAQNRATKDRKPLVRIILTDTISNKVAAVGYLKFNIVDETVINKSEVVLAQNFSFNREYTVDCTTDTLQLPLTWHQIEEQILAQLETKGISKEEFHTNFKLEGGEENATQYNGVTVESVAVAEKVGVVEQTTTDDKEEMTQVLTWIVKNNQAYQEFNAGAKSIAVNVRYSYEVSTGVYQYVYVTFTWTPSPLNITPNGTIDNATAKIDKYWYAKNGAVAGSGYSDIHANVKQVISNSATDCTFNSDILNTLTGNKITVTSDATYPAFADANLKKIVVFANPQDHLTKVGENYVVNGASGAQYVITVSADGKTLQATKDATTEAVVVLNGTVMEYQEKDFAKDILNNADHNLLGADETFTAKLQFNAFNCESVTYALSNKVFYAKYLRPVSINPSDVDELVDATNGASIAALTLNLIDWRDKHFDVEAETTGDDGTKYDFYGFYGVTEIAADIANATTTLNNGTLGTTKLTDVTNNVELYFGAEKSTNAATPNTNTFSNPTVGDNGKFYYYNNGTTLGKFTIRVPLVVTYKWGKIYTSVDLNINKTVQN